MDQLLEMYVDDRNKLNSIFLSRDPNRIETSSNNDNNDDQPPPPPPPASNNTTYPSNTTNYNLPTTETFSDDINQPSQKTNVDSNLSKSALKYLIETQSRPLTKMSFNLVEQFNDHQKSSEPNTPVCRNLDRPMQRGNSDLIANRFIATSKNTPMIRIENVSNAQFKKQLQDLQHKKLEQSTMHNVSQNIESQQLHTQIEQRLHQEASSELPLSAHPVTSTELTLDYSRRMPSTITHSISFPVYLLLH